MKLKKIGFNVLIVAMVILIGVNIYYISQRFDLGSIFAAKENAHEEDAGHEEDADHEEGAGIPRDLLESESGKKVIDILNAPDKFKGEKVTLELEFFKSEDQFFAGYLVKPEGEEHEQFLGLMCEVEDLELVKDIKHEGKVSLVATVDVVENEHGDHHHEMPVLKLEEITALAE